MVAEWVPCGSVFIEADVIRWTEGVWRKPRRNRGRAMNLGDRVVTAEVINDDGEWVHLLVRDCTVATENTGHKVTLLAKTLEVRRSGTRSRKGNLSAFSGVMKRRARR